jgi:hypothetical protein
MVSVLASSAIDHMFEPRSGQTKDYKIGTNILKLAEASIVLLVLVVSSVKSKNINL